MVSVHQAIAVLVLVAPLAVHAAEAGDVTFPVLLGTNVWTHNFAQNGQPAKTVTIADRCVLIESIGAGYYVTDRLRVGFSVQFNEAVTNPPPTSAFTQFSLNPQVNYNFWGPLTVTVGTSFVLRLNGISQFGFAPFGALSAGVPLGAGFSFIGGIAVPFFITPVTSVGLVPFVGFSFKLPRNNE
jgi:hypothetical protein